MHQCLILFLFCFCVCSFVCLVGTKMVVRAVAAVLTAEEQAMNPTPHPRQRRTRPGDWTYSEKEIW